MRFYMQDVEKASRVDKEDHVIGGIGEVEETFKEKIGKVRYVERVMEEEEVEELFQEGKKPVAFSRGSMCCLLVEEVDYVGERLVDGGGRRRGVEESVEGGFDSGEERWGEGVCFDLGEEGFMEEG